MQQHDCTTTAQNLAFWKETDIATALRDRWKRDVVTDRHA